MKNRLFDLRTERNLSQEELAKQIDYSQQIISHYESGKNQKVSMDFENKICDFFGCDDTLKKVAGMIEEFYKGNGNEKRQDLTDEELASFLEFISQFKDLLQKFPK